MKADYQLKHQLFGRQGSMWERQVDAETRTRVRGVVKTAGNSTVLSQLDLIAGSALGSGRVLSEDAYFKFQDGNFATIGRHLSEYSHHSAVTESGVRLHVAYRPKIGTSSSAPLPTKIAKVTNDFIRAINKDAGLLPSDRDWYLVPIPQALRPIVIEGRNKDEYLVQGIDFLLRDGYIAMTDSPGDVLPFGLVRVPVAQRAVSAPNAFVLSTPSGYTGGRYLAEYAYKSQALSTFRRAAAEYAGLYVFQTADVVISIKQVTASEWVYTTAAAGAISINYPHIPLVVGQEVSPGYVICNGLEVISSRYNDPANPKQNAAGGWGDLSMDGVLPVNGLTWDAGTSLELDSVANDPISGKPHLRPQFDGDSGNLSRFWEFSRLHEQQTQTFLYDYLGAPALPTTVNLWDLLEGFYGIQLVLVLAGGHTPLIDSRLHTFLKEFHPASCTILLGLRTTALPEGGAERDENGVPVVSDDGEYVVAPPVEACADLLMSYRGDVAAYGGVALTYFDCEEYDLVTYELVYEGELLAHSGDVLIYNS